MAHLVLGRRRPPRLGGPPGRSRRGGRAALAGAGVGDGEPGRLGGSGPCRIPGACGGEACRRGSGSPPRGAWRGGDGEPRGWARTQGGGAAAGRAGAKAGAAWEPRKHLDPWRRLGPWATSGSGPGLPCSGPAVLTLACVRHSHGLTTCYMEFPLMRRTEIPEPSPGIRPKSCLR